MINEISTFKAKTHFSNLIVKIEHGESFLITKRGKPVAKIIPYKPETNEVNFIELVSSFKKIRNKVKGKINIKELKEMGRKK